MSATITPIGAVWHTSDMTADDARVLRAEDREASMTRHPSNQSTYAERLAFQQSAVARAKELRATMLKLAIRTLAGATAIIAICLLVAIAIGQNA